MEDITSDRAKEILCSYCYGRILLRKGVRRNQGDTKNSSAVCKYYFTENVISNSFISDHIKALGAAYSLFSANEVYFRDEDGEHILNHERYEWIRDDKEHGSCICFYPR